MRCRHFNYETDNSQCIKDAELFYRRKSDLSRGIVIRCKKHPMSKLEYNMYPSYEEAKLALVKAML